MLSTSDEANQRTWNIISCYIWHVNCFYNIITAQTRIFKLFTHYSFFFILSHLKKILQIEPDYSNKLYLFWLKKNWITRIYSRFYYVMKCPEGLEVLKLKWSRNIISYIKRPNFLGEQKTIWRRFFFGLIWLKRFLQNM